jgi:hypothetical protein
VQHEREARTNDDGDDREAGGERDRDRGGDRVALDLSPADESHLDRHRPERLGDDEQRRRDEKPPPHANERDADGDRRGEREERDAERDRTERSERRDEDGEREQLDRDETRDRPTERGAFDLCQSEISACRAR